MDAKTLEALKGSIAKWERIVRGTGGSQGSDNCPLCQIFLRDNERCYGCPVQKAVRKHLCRGTPYADLWIPADTAYEFSEGHMAKNDESRLAAQAELDFLRSLLPEAPGQSIPKQMQESGE